jgi:DNA-binding transcriptional MocR family regulator
VDADGVRVDELPDDVAAVVVSPDHQFPAGGTLSSERRRALVEWAVAGERLVVEHDYDGHFRYDRPPAGSLQALAPEHAATSTAICGARRPRTGAGAASRRRCSQPSCRVPSPAERRQGSSST